MKLFVWDFHGVLEKGNEGAVLEISNKILGDFRYKERFRDTHKVKVIRTKGDVLRGFLDGKSFDDIVVIGDRPEDVAMENISGGVSYLYAHPGRDFHQAEADFWIRDLREVLREV